MSIHVRVSIFVKVFCLKAFLAIAYHMHVHQNNILVLSKLSCLLQPICETITLFLGLNFIHLRLD